MKVLAFTSLVVAALGASSAMAQSQPLTRDQVKTELTQAQSSGALERTDQNYGTWWADTPSSPNYNQSYSAGPASSDTGMASSTPMAPDSSSMGAAGRSYDGSSSGMSSDAASGGAGMGSSSGMSSDTTGMGAGMSSDGTSSSSTLQGSTSSSPMGTTSTYGSSDSAALGAAGRSYDGSTASGPASRADVIADRDNAMRSGRWIFNDLDGVQRLEPGWNSHEGRVYKGPSDSY